MIGFCAFIVTYTYKTGVWLPCTTRLQGTITKHGHGSKRTYVGIVAPPYHVFLNFALHVIQDPDKSRSDPDDPRDPTRFQLWYRISCAVKVMLT